MQGWSADHLARVLGAHLVCRFCRKLFVEPVELPCGHVICSPCAQFVHLRGGSACPSCGSPFPNPAGMASPPQKPLRGLPILERLLEELQEEGDKGGKPHPIPDPTLHGCDWVKGWVSGSCFRCQCCCGKPTSEHLGGQESERKPIEEVVSTMRELEQTAPAGLGRVPTPPKPQEAPTPPTPPSPQQDPVNEVSLRRALSLAPREDMSESDVLVKEWLDSAPRLGTIERFRPPASQKSVGQQDLFQVEGAEIAEHQGGEMQSQRWFAADSEEVDPFADQEQNEPTQDVTTGGSVVASTHAAKAAEYLCQLLISCKQAAGQEVDLIDQLTTRAKNQRAQPATPPQNSSPSATGAVSSSGKGRALPLTAPVVSPLPLPTICLESKTETVILQSPDPCPLPSAPSPPAPVSPPRKRSKQRKRKRDSNGDTQESQGSAKKGPLMSQMIRLKGSGEAKPAARAQGVGLLEISGDRPGESVPLISTEEFVRLDAGLVGISGLSDEQRTRVEHSVEQMGGRYTTLDALQPELTHLVVPANESVEADGSVTRRSKRTLKYSFAMACGAWVVSYQWVEESRKRGRWIAPERFEIHGVEQAGEGDLSLGAPKRAREGKLSGRRLLQGFVLHFARGSDPGGQGPTVKQYEFLAQVAGAQVVTLSEANRVWREQTAGGSPSVAAGGGSCGPAEVEAGNTDGERARVSCGSETLGASPTSNCKEMSPLAAGQGQVLVCVFRKPRKKGETSVPYIKNKWVLDCLGNYAVMDWRNFLF